ncbi:hypothetical protein [Prevotella denticola]|uniref:hypothetical protein n=1 Tax=Prevotella denticola TaxID=28129 RepID=UPI0028E5A7A3|nr:hypothetical protein [Prevotella denticola]
MLVYIFILIFATTNEEEDNNNRTKTEQREEKIKSEFISIIATAYRKRAAGRKEKRIKRQDTRTSR